MRRSRSGNKRLRRLGQVAPDPFRGLYILTVSGHVVDIANESELPDLIARTAASLRELAIQIEKGTLLEPIDWTIPMSDVASDRMSAHCDLIASRLGNKQLGVYAIYFDEGVPVERVYQFIDQNKIENNKRPVAERRAFAKVNERELCLGSRCLYVGKSKNTSSRLKQHLIEAPIKTYAIHMKYWPRDISGNLIVKTIGVAGVESALLPFIEDQLAREMPPILGKRGSV
jgi:hypothetical protein